MKVIEFAKYRKVSFLISFLCIAALGIYTFLSNGFNLSVDFQSGLNLEINLNEKNNIDISNVKNVLDKDFSKYQVKRIGSKDKSRFSLTFKDDRTKDFKTQMPSKIINLLKVTYPNIKQESIYYVSGKFSSGLAWQMALLSFLSLLIILVYLSFRFKISYAISSVIALFHDVLFIIFLIGALKIEVSTSTVAAILTMIGYSLNDTIVVFDRIRENENKAISRDFLELISISITQSLSRTILTSFTTLIAIIAILIFTTGQVSDFALVMVFGIIVGTYSSIFIASPFVYYLKGGKKAKIGSGLTVVSNNNSNNKDEVAKVQNNKVEASKTEKAKNSSKTSLSNIDFESERKKLQNKIKNKRKKNN